jgi:hypothetical protein
MEKGGSYRGGFSDRSGAAFLVERVAGWMRNDRGKVVRLMLQTPDSEAFIAMA